MAFWILHFSSWVDRDCGVVFDVTLFIYLGL